MIVSWALFSIACVGLCLTIYFYNKRLRQADKSLRQADLDKVRLEEKLRVMGDVKEQATKDFKILANEILEKQLETQKKNLGEMLNPFGQSMGNFRQQFTQDNAALRESLKNLTAESKSVQSTADSLAQALRGDVKQQGNWGEITLERILEVSGLVKGVNYTIQGIGEGLQTDEGKRQMPDVVVKLPDDKNIVIDAKVSLKSYEAYCAASTDAEKKQHLKNLQTSVKTHIKNLSSKNYQSMQGSPEFILLFMPIEGAYSLCVQQDRELFSQAWEQRIAVVCPTTLFPALHTIRSLWRLVERNQQADAIADRAGKMIDKLTGFIESMDKVGNRLKQADKEFHEARNRLSEGHGNVLSQAKELQSLGAKSTKVLPNK